MDCSPLRVLFRQHPPLATALEDVQQPTKHVIKVDFPGLRLLPCRLQYRPDLLKLLTADVAWITHSEYLSKTCRILLILNLEQVLRYAAKKFRTKMPDTSPTANEIPRVDAIIALSLSMLLLTLLPLVTINNLARL